MQDSTRPVEEQQAIGRALSVLAIATRDHTIDAAVMRVYMPHFDRFTVEEVEGGCESLHAADYFPKVGELLRAVGAYRRKLYDAEQARRASRALPDPSNRPVSPEKHRELMERIKRTVRPLGGRPGLGKLSC